MMATRVPSRGRDDRVKGGAVADTSAALTSVDRIEQDPPRKGHVRPVDRQSCASLWLFLTDLAILEQNRRKASRNMGFSGQILREKGDKPFRVGK